MDDKEKMTQVEGWLRLIERTRLFCNTSDKLQEMVGFAVTNRNSLSRKGGNSLFMKEAIFHQLGHICMQETGLDLQTVVEAYEDVDNFIDRYSIKLRGKQLAAQIVDMFYGEGSVPEDLAFVDSRLDSRHIPILLLMLEDCLPRLSTKGGDVKTIDSDFARTFSMLRGACRYLITNDLPVLVMEEAEMRENPEKKNRLQLIATTKRILETYGAVSTKQRFSITTKEMAWDRCYPNIEGIWTEDDAYTAFWLFETITNGYHLYHYRLQNDPRQLLYTKYTITFFETDEGDIWASMVHPNATRFLIQGQTVPTSMFMFVDFEHMSDGILLTPRKGSGKWFTTKHLRRSTHQRLYQSYLDDETMEKVNEFADDEYMFQQNMVAITPDHIYVKHPQKGYYKVPKALCDVLYDVQFGESVGTLTFAGGTYIAFDDKNLYYDVTTEENMNEFGIEVVDAISE